MIEVKTQAQLDAAVKKGETNIVLRGDGYFGVSSGSATVEASDSATVVAWDSATVRASGSATVRAFASVIVRLFGGLKITATSGVVILIHKAAKSMKGGQRIKVKKPKTAKDWCEHYGVKVNRGVATLYKAVDEDFRSLHGADYTPGTIPVADDWDSGKAECGGGLHFSPQPWMALSFSNGPKFVACPVRLKDIAVHPDGHYPEKVKAKGCCKPVYEVDRDGERIQPKSHKEAA